MNEASIIRRGRALRCAVYTRKSSEEGLDQEFNSLHAQREACEAYIKSQRHEGWTCLAQHYDDGGLSGATMDRPALQQLLADIQAGKVDAVVTYKVDRLTRSLADFAKIVEIFDAKGVSFVSVTQQFNTTTSMGRLTLMCCCPSPSSSARSRASESATRSPPRRRRGCGWAASPRWATT
jgi:site-specific DNA recombinase